MADLAWPGRRGRPRLHQAPVEGLDSDREAEPDSSHGTGDPEGLPQRHCGTRRTPRPPCPCEERTGRAVEEHREGPQPDDRCHAGVHPAPGPRLVEGATQHVGLSGRHRLGEADQSRTSVRTHVQCVVHECSDVGLPARDARVAVDRPRPFMADEPLTLEAAEDRQYRRVGVPW